MFKKILATSVASLAIAAAMAMPAKADVSIMYADWLSSLVEPGIAAYEAATGEKVNAIKLPGDGYVERVALDLSAGTAADVIQMDSFVVSELASAGYVEPLDSLAQSWDQYQYYMKGLLDVVSYDNHVYALPTDTDVRMLWYNKKLFTDAGIAMPWEPKSWDDVLAAAKQIKEKTGIEDAFLLPAGTKQGEAATMQGFYMALLGADVPEGGRNRLRDWAAGKWVGDSPALRRTLELYKKVYQDEKLAGKAINYATDIGAAVHQEMLGNKLGILASGSWEYACMWDCDGVKAPAPADRDAIMGWAPWPGSGLPGTKTSTNISGGWAIGLNAKSKNKEAAQKLLTTIFDYANFEKWTVANGRMAVRTDISGSKDYQANSYLATATKMAEETTGRDTYPGYQRVSALVQEMTAAILDGSSVEDAITEYKNGLIDEFGADNVITYE